MILTYLMGKRNRENDEVWSTPYMLYRVTATTNSLELRHLVTVRVRSLSNLLDEFFQFINQGRRS